MQSSPTTLRGLSFSIEFEVALFLPLYGGLVPLPVIRHADRNAVAVINYYPIAVKLGTNIVGKYRKYGKKQKSPRRRLKRMLSALGVALSFLYILMTMYGSIPIEGDLFELFVGGAKVINATLFKVTYIGSPPENKNFTIWLQIDDRSVEFSIPGGEYGKVAILGVSRLIDVAKEMVQPKIIIPDARINITYPGPPINTSTVGRTEDYVISHYPLELYFVFATQLCNVTILAKSSEATFIEARLIYSDKEEGGKKETSLYCRGNTCEGDIRGGCVLSYDLVSELTYLGLFRLKHESGKTVLRFIDNLWISVLLLITTIGILFTVYKRGTTPVKKRI